MIEYTGLNNSIYLIDHLTISGNSLLSGNNNFNFNAGNFYNRVSAGYNAVPIQFIIQNTTTIDFTKWQFQTGADTWNSYADILKGRYTILFPFDKNKGNHIHIDAINNPLSVSFNNLLGTSAGQINITVLFSSWL